MNTTNTQAAPDSQAVINQRSRISKVLSEMEKRGEWFDVYNDYSEPGYYLDDENCPVVAANWNNGRFPYGDDKPLSREENFMPRAAETLEKLGCSIEWSDEWTGCCECGNAIRTQADSYDWKPSYKIFNDCELVCADCLANDPDDYFESLHGSTVSAHTIDSINPAEYGYHRLGFTFESGFHPGQNDRPEDIAAIMESEGIERWFFDYASSQFYVSFGVWVHDDERKENREGYVKSIERLEELAS